MNEILKKINDLTFKEKRNYFSNLKNICEFRDECILYGAKDPVNLPDEDFERIQINLYNQMFGENYKIDKL